jgi:hypothetical protein
LLSRSCSAGKGASMSDFDTGRIISSIEASERSLKLELDRHTTHMRYFVFIVAAGALTIALLATTKLDRQKMPMVAASAQACAPTSDAVSK